MKTIATYIFCLLITTSIQAQSDSFTESFEDETPGSSKFTVEGLEFTLTGDLQISEFQNFSCNGNQENNKFVDSNYLDGPSSGIIGSIVAPAGFTFQLATEEQQCSWSGLDDGNTPSTGTIRFTGETIYNTTISEDITITSSNETDMTAFQFNRYIWGGIELKALQLEIVNGLDYIALDNLMFTSINVESNCLVGHAATGGLFSNRDVEIGQSFMNSCNGYLSYIQLGAIGTFYETTPEFVLSIYDGNTVSGTPIFTQIVPEITHPFRASKLKFQVDNGPFLKAESQYTFTVNIGAVFRQLNSNNPFKEGNAFVNGSPVDDRDFEFDISIDDSTLSIQDHNLSEEIVLFPNPSSDYINISNLNFIDNFIIYDAFGKEVDTVNTSGGSKISITHLKNGIYFLKLKSSQNVFKFIKN
ncbi:T9SS type A sorting domain-containing protein [Aquimarina sp. SS2-1]|uniref:T9SS type A sorting domain-containing protein n=1 Tax=Aquimarina besae TaxID=3342247 RepID=UPI00366E2DC1